VLGCSLSVPAPVVPVPSQEATTAAVAAVLDDWHDAAARADEARYFGHLDDDSVFLGTDPNERWDKRAFRAYARPHFAKGKAWEFHSVRRAIAIDGSNLVHFDEDLRTKRMGAARGSGVLEKRAGSWRIIQYNLAITVPNDRFDLAKEAAGTAELLKAEAGAADTVAFMAGAWVGQDEEGAKVEEHWTQAAAGSLIGMSRTTKGSKLAFFEHLRIESREGGSLVYVAQPMGKPPTDFKRVESAKNEAVFENLKHDWPKRIRYRREGETLHVRVEGGLGQRAFSLVLKAALVERSR